MSDDDTTLVTGPPPDDVSAKLADFAAELLKLSEKFAAASGEVGTMSGVTLFTHLLDLARNIETNTEKLHDFRRYLTSLVRKKTLPL